MNDNHNLPTYLTVKQLVEKHAALTEGGVRGWIFNATSNGFDHCIKRVGRKLLINEARFFEWIGQQSKQTAENQMNGGV